MTSDISDIGPHPGAFRQDLPRLDRRAMMDIEGRSHYSSLVVRLAERKAQWKKNG